MKRLEIKELIMNQNKEKFTNCNLSKKETEGRLIAVNDKFLAMSWDEQGEIVIVNSSEPHDINEKQPHLIVKIFMI